MRRANPVDNRDREIFFRARCWRSARGGGCAWALRVSLRLIARRRRIRSSALLTPPGTPRRDRSSLRRDHRRPCVSDRSYGRQQSVAGPVAPGTGGARRDDAVLRPDACRGSSAVVAVAGADASTLRGHERGGPAHGLATGRLTAGRDLDGHVRPVVRAVRPPRPLGETAVASELHDVRLASVEHGQRRSSFTGVPALPSKVPSEWACSAVGSAPEWHSGGHRFDPGQVHHPSLALRAKLRMASPASLLRSSEG